MEEMGLEVPGSEADAEVEPGAEPAPIEPEPEQGVAEGSSTNAEVTKRAKAAAQKAGKTFNTDVEYRLWYAITTQANAATRKASKKQGVAEGSSCNMTMEGDYCPEHGLMECGMHEGAFHNPEQTDSPAAQAITRRILLQRTDLLSKYGPEKVGQAIDEVADFIGDVEEIGSSDVSGWVRHVEQMLGNMGDDVGEGVDDPINYNGAITGSYYESKQDPLARIKSLALRK
jgi:hypothetical protein